MATRKPAAKKSAAKKPAAKKPAAKKKTAKKPRLVCGLCGMQVIIDKACGCAEAHPLICCGKPMASR